MDAKYVEENLKRISEYTFINSNLFWEMEAGEHQNDIEFLLNVIYEQKKREELWKKMVSIDSNFIQKMYDLIGEGLMDAGKKLRDDYEEIRNEIDQL